MNTRSDFGARLKQARDTRGLSLRDIANTTKIAVAVLNALERGDASKLPGGIFSRAFVRSYAAEVGIDPERTVCEFLELFPSDTNPISNAPPAMTAIDDTRDRHWGRVLFGTFVLAAAAATAFVLMGWVSADWLRFDRPATEAAAAPTLPPPPSRPVTAAPAPPAAELTSPSAPPAAEPAPPAVHDVAHVSQSDLLRLVVQPTDRCWVHIVADGSVVFSREMSAGEREVSEARERFVVTVGNAGAFAYTINDVPGRPLGADGKVVKVRIDRATLPEFVAD